MTVTTSTVFTLIKYPCSDTFTASPFLSFIQAVKSFMAIVCQHTLLQLYRCEPLASITGAPRFYVLKPASCVVPPGCSAADKGV